MSPTQPRPESLEEELQTFGRQLPHLLKDVENRGKFALVKGESIAVFPTVDDALDAGYERFGVEPFLVKEITEHEEPRYFSRRIAKCR
jgi:hypothetical protein